MRAIVLDQQELVDTFFLGHISSISVLVFVVWENPVKK